MQKMGVTTRRAMLGNWPTELRESGSLLPADRPRVPTVQPAPHLMVVIATGTKSRRKTNRKEGRQMKRYAKVAVTGLLSALLATSAVAQSSNASAAGQANANANAEAAGEATYGMLISGLQDGTLTAQDPVVELGAVNEDTPVNIELLSAVKGAAAENAEALEAALAEQDAWVMGVKEAVDSNTVLVTALDAEGFNSNDVVAFNADAEGGVTLIVDDSM